MTRRNLTFRIFVSSTFSDLKAERNALQQEVFPKLRELCMQHGCRFQAIDLRWGVSEEAALDQQTMKICLEEIKRCQRATPRPNFIVLLGDRYGWRPLPAEIPAEEFAQIESRVTDANDKALLANWYKRDDNAVPAVYCLQPRAVRFSNNQSKEEQEAACQAEADEWGKTEHELRRILLAAIAALPFTAEQRLKYEASATEQEIMAGALNETITDAREHVFGFFRSFKTLPQDASAKDFVDLDDDGTPDIEAHTRLEALKERLRQKLPGNISSYETEWTGKDIMTAHLTQLCEDVYQSLSQVILAEIAQLEAANPIEEEARAHERFGAERARFFTGRTNYLRAISDYINGADPHPLAIHGASGSGKSALLAQAIAECGLRNADWVIVSRFIGATPNSSDGRALLENLCRQISRRYGADEASVPAEYQKLVEELPRSLALATADKPLIVFIDALDQLSDFEHARNLIWLPRDLPAHVRLIVSTLDPGECLTQLERKLPKANLVKLEPMPKEEGGKLLDLWLAEAGRRLQDEQRVEVLGKFAANGLPLYLKLAFEEARHWKSYSQPSDFSTTILGILQDLFDRLEKRANHGYMLVSRSLAYLSAARRGLTEDELLDLLSADEEVLADFKHRSPQSPEVRQLPVVVWSRLHADLGSYLAERWADNSVLLSFYHRQLNGAVSERYLNGDDQFCAHQKLANYFRGRADPFGNNTWTSNDLRGLRELPFHLAQSGQQDSLKSTLHDFLFMQAKLKAFGPFPLIEDYDLAATVSEKKLDKKDKSLSLIQGTLQLSAYVLSRDDLRLAEQLVGRLVAFEIPEIQSLLEQARHWKGAPWLCSLVPSLAPPGGPLLRNIEVRASSLALTPDGKCVVSGSDDGIVKVWDLENGICLRTLEGHSGNVRAVVVTADGKWIITASSDSTVKVWDLETGRELRTLAGHTSSVISVAVTPDDRWVVSGCDDGTLKVWNLNNGDCSQTLAIESYRGSVEAVAVTPDCRRAISGTTAAIIGWDLESGNCLGVLPVRGICTAVAVTPDGRRFVTAARNILQVWDLERGRCLHTLRGHLGDQYINAVAIMPDSKRAVSGSDDTMIKVWDLESGNCLRTLEGHSSSVRAMAVTSDGKQAISVSSDGLLKVWDMESEADPTPLQQPAPRVWAVAVIPDGQQIISGYHDGTLRLWDVYGKCLHTLEGDEGPITSVSVIPNGRRIVSASMDSPLMKNMDLGWAAVPGLFVTPSFSSDSTLKIWDLENGHCLRALKGHSGLVKAVAVTPDGRQAISGAADNSLRVWDLESGTCLYTLKGHDEPVWAVAVTPNGKYVVSASLDKTLKVWDLKKGICLRTLEGHTEGIIAVAVTPNGDQAISASKDRTLRVWNLGSGDCQHILEGHSDEVRAVAVTADSKWVISGSSDNTLRVWDLDVGNCQITFLGEATADAIATTPDGRMIAAGDSAGRVYIMQLKNIVPGAPVVTPWYSATRWQFWRRRVAFSCPYCCVWSEVSQSALGTELHCLHCGAQLKLNYFSMNADWHLIARLWKGK